MKIMTTIVMGNADSRCFSLNVSASSSSVNRSGRLSGSRFGRRKSIHSRNSSRCRPFGFFS